MKKLVPLALLALATTVCISAQQAQSSQSVADAARKQSADGKSAPAHKVWTNDDFPDRPAPAAEPASVDPAAGAAATTDDAKKTADADKDKSKDATADKEKDKPKDAGDQDKIDAEWKSKLDAQKAKIADLQREYDLTDREFKLASTTYYADAGNRLRDPKDFHDKEASYHEKLDTLKTQIADEQTKLADLQDKAHKAGANKAYD